MGTPGSDNVATYKYYSHVLTKKRLSNKFRQPLFCVVHQQKNKAFMLNFSAKAFVMSKIFSKFGLQVNN